MKKLILLFVAAILLSGCYTVNQVGNCKYYTPKFKSSRYNTHQMVSF